MVIKTNKSYALSERQLMKKAKKIAYDYLHEYYLDHMDKEDLYDLYKNYDERLIEITGEARNVALYEIPQLNRKQELWQELDVYVSDLPYRYGLAKYGDNWKPPIMYGRKVTVRKSSRKTTKSTLPNFTAGFRKML